MLRFILYLQSASISHYDLNTFIKPRRVLSFYTRLPETNSNINKINCKVQHSTSSQV